MPEKFGQKVLIVVISSILSFAVMLVLLAATNRLGKADVEYVDKQDAVIQKNFDDYKGEHNQRHIQEYEQTDRYLRLIMDYWNIEYTNPEDEK